MRLGLFAVAALVVSAAAAGGQDRNVQVYGPFEKGVVRPVLIKRVEVAYTPEARLAGIVGDIKLEVVVMQDGSIGDVKVFQSCLGRITTDREPNGDPFRCRSADEYERASGIDQVKGRDLSLGLDQQAQKAMQQWVFRSGTKDGKPVAVRMVIGLTLRPGGSK